VGVLQNSVNGTNLSGAITLAGLSMIRTDASTTLTISNITDGLDMSTNELNIGGAGNITFSGKLTGSSGTTSIFRKDGIGTLTLSNDNGISFTGPIVVNPGGGILAATHANALGTTGEGTTVFNQASLQLGVTNIAEPINIRGHGFGQTGTVASIGALYAADNFTYTGLLTVDSTATLSSISASKILTIDAPGSIVMNDKVLNLNGAGNLIVNTTITGSTTLNKWGIGTTTLSGDNGSSYTGPIVVNVGSGILQANHANALGSTGAGTTVFNQASLQLGVTDIAEPVNIRGHGFGQSTTVATIGAFYASDSYTYKGALTIDSTATIASVTAAKVLTLDNTTSALLSNNTVGGNGYTINGAGDISITGKLTGIGSMTKSGTGTTTLSFDNSTGTAYDALTNVIDGILRITDGKALGTSTSTRHTVVSGTGSVQLENNITVLEPFTLTSTSTNGAIRNQSGKNTLQGLITLNAAGTSKIISAGADNINDSLLIVTGGINTGSLATTYVGLETLKGMRITGTISGSGGFIKSGADTLLLYNTNGNTFTGIATLFDGIVRINNKSALGDSANTITTNYTQINSGATLFIDFKDVVLRESFIINGIGEIISGDTLGPIKTREGRNYLSGTIKVNSNSFINTGVDFVKNKNTDSLIFNLINTDAELTLKTNLGTRVIGGISGNGSIVKAGLDTLVYTGANTYRGYTKINEGCLLLGASLIMPNTNSGNELILNGGTLSSGGKENNFGRLSITENSKINLRFVDVHKLTFATGGSYRSNKKVVIYGWSGLTGGVVTPVGKIESTNVIQASVYLRSSGKTDKSKSGGVQASGQIVSTALGVDFNGRIYMNSSPQLTQFQRDRIRFYYDKNEVEFSATQAAGGELLAENPIAIEPSTVFVGSTLTTTAISSLSNISATSGGNITAALNDSVLVRGVVWSTSSNPTVDLATKTIDGTSKGSFTSNITGLTPGTLYYVRAYATNSNSTDYGTQVSFTTQTPPTLNITTTPSSVTASTAISGGNISSANGFTMVTRGVVWSTSANPTIALSTKTAEASTAIGSFTANLTGLTANTTYFIRSYATNTSGTDYGPQTTFTTLTAPTGLTSTDPAISAFAIKQAYPSSTDGFYWIQNANINSGTPVRIYADMTTDGGGWTLILKNSNVTGWNSTNALLQNHTSIPYTTNAEVISTSTANYSIIQWADFIKRNNTSAPFFQYMIDANTRGRFGGIFNANVNYSFTSSSNANTNVALASKFGTWSFDDGSIEQRMPYYTSSASGGLITTSASFNNNWWGTLISNAGFSPAPWIGSVAGTEGNMSDPGIIWYWVR
jgi:autotransporter-associated beta strand protein